MTVGTMV